MICWFMGCVGVEARSSVQYRCDRMVAADMITLVEVAALVGTGRVTINTGI